MFYLTSKRARECCGKYVGPGLFKRYMRLFTNWKVRGSKRSNSNIFFFSTHVDTDPEAQPASCTISTMVVLPTRMKDDGSLTVNIHTHLALKLSMSIIIPLIHYVPSWHNAFT
jgi:hypothetical protein